MSSAISGQVLLIRAPAGSAGVLLTRPAPTAEEPAGVRRDEVRYAEDPGVLFADGFETGDTGARGSGSP